MSKSGPVYLIPCDRCQDLANQIDALETTDQELLDLGQFLRRYTKGFAKICVAEEDNILWEGGPDIRDYQFGRGKVEVTLIELDGPNEGVYSNQPLRGEEDESAE